MVQQIKNLPGIHEDAGSLASLGGLRTWRCCKVQPRSQMQRGSCVAVAGV